MYASRQSTSYSGNGAVKDPYKFFVLTGKNFGEDPHLVSKFGLAEMSGIQGSANVGPDVNASTYMVDPQHHPISQVKHYAAYGGYVCPSSPLGLPKFENNCWNR